jgi:L-fuconolactonase
MKIDAHHHLWDPSKRDYPWMSGARFDPIRRRYDLADPAAETAGIGVSATVLVQTVSATAESEEFLAAAASGGLIAGVIGWVDLTAPSVEDELACLADARGGERLVGIRHQVEDEPDPQRSSAQIAESTKPRCSAVR